jgi:hypothetical protein
VGGVCDDVVCNKTVNDSGQSISQHACRIEMRTAADGVFDCIYHMRSVRPHQPVNLSVKSEVQ